MAFYKHQDSEVIEAENGVAAPDYELHAFEKDLYQLPIDGWYWFDLKEDAYAFFGVALPAPEPAPTEGRP